MNHLRRRSYGEKYRELGVRRALEKAGVYSTAVRVGRVFGARPDLYSRWSQPGAVPNKKLRAKPLHPGSLAKARLTMALIITFEAEASPN